MLKKLMYCAVVPVLIVLVSLYAADQYMLKKIYVWYPSSGVWHLYGNDIKDKGITLLKLSVENKHMIVLGTSELKNMPEYHVLTSLTNSYPNQDWPYDVDIVGQAGAETLVNVIRYGSIDGIEKVPVMFDSSMTWFVRSKYPDAALQKNLSEVQYYYFMDNPKLSTDIKVNVAKEVEHITRGNPLFNELWLHAKIKSSESVKARVLGILLEPYYKGRKWFLSYRDHLRVFKLLKSKKGKFHPSTHRIDWENDEEKYSAQARSLCFDDSSHFYIYKENWKRPWGSSKNSWAKLKNHYSDLDYAHSNGYYYHQLFLETAKELGGRPLVLLCAANGYAFDYVGLDYSKRKVYFNKMTEIQEQEQMPYINSSFLEYIPYVFQDEAHYNSKGWFILNREITSYFKGNWNRSNE